MINIPKIDIFYSIKEKIRTEIKIKCSKFIATALPVNNLEDFHIQINSLRKEFYDATHNCFAYKIRMEKDYEAYSDDGEPSGSAGKPIFFMINKYELTNIMVVVTRYFGGTKLGVGGLVRAYSQAAEECLKIAEKREVIITESISFDISYSEQNNIKKLIEEYAVKHKENYTDKICVNIDVPKSLVNEFKSKLFEITLGKISL